MGGASFRYNPSGDRFVRRGWGNVVVLFDAISGQELFRTHSLPAASECDLLRFDRTGQRLAAARVGDSNDRIGLWSVADAREYRTLVCAAGGDNETAGILYLPAIHPAGRLAAIGLKQGVALFDLETGRALARLPINNSPTHVSFDGKGSLLTNGFEGFFRWPVKEDAANPGRLIIGPAERLPFHPGSSEISASRDGRVIAQCMWTGSGMELFTGGWILHPNSPTPRRVDAGKSTGWCSVSPDGRWVAFGGPKLVAGRAAINVYETATAQRVWQLPVEGYHGLFSRDGRWLITDADGGRAYTVDTWELGPQLGPGRPWDLTSHLAVFGQTNGIYRLVELATGRELARLEDPELIAGAAAFTADGTKLVVTAKNGLRVWDLRRIRAELAKLGLDWDAPPLPAASGPPAAPLSIHVELGHVELDDTFRRAQAHSLVVQSDKDFRAKEHAKALAALRQAVKIAPSLAMAHNALAWRLLTGPKELCDPTQALSEARKAVELEPKQPLYVNTLGVTLYYAGQYADAIPVLERSLREQKGKADAYNLFFLAMCHHRLGDAVKGKDCHQRGKQWFLDHRWRLSADWLEELMAFQAEADIVLAQPPGQGKK
jgi:WD40 repeat protein